MLTCESNLKNNDESCDGFEGNAQTFRIITKLEEYNKASGLNLTRRTLLGILKYPVKYPDLNHVKPKKNIQRNRDIKIDDWKPPKCYYNLDQKAFEWVMQSFTLEDIDEFKSFNDNNSLSIHGVSKYKSFDCSIMDIADDIANSVHDLEDAFFLGMVNLEIFKDSDKDGVITKFFNKEYMPGDSSCIKDFFSKDYYRQKRAFGHMVHKLVTGVILNKNENFVEPILRYNAKFESGSTEDKVVKMLKEIVMKNTYLTQEVETVVFGGMMTIMQLFDAIKSNPDKLLPKTFDERQRNENCSCERRVCDYLSGMTDDYARRLHHRIYGSSPGSVFEKL